MRRQTGRPCRGPHRWLRDRGGGPPDAQREAADRLGAAPLTDEPYDIVADAAGTASALVEAAVVLEP